MTANSGSAAWINPHSNTIYSFGTPTFPSDEYLVTSCWTA